jgi:hypothetical protein
LGISKRFRQYAKWHPAVATDKTEQKKDENGDMATFRTLTLKSGGTIVEKLRSIDDKDMK